MIQSAHQVPPLVIYGAGGHGQVVADAARASGLEVLGFIDDGAIGENAGAAASPRLDPADPRLEAAQFHIAIGDNADRLRLLEQLRDAGRDVVSVVHPDATVSAGVRLEPGTYIGPRAVVGPGAYLGPGCIVNSAAIVEHHNALGSGVHLAPAATLAGGVQVGSLTLIGIGATVLPGVTLGRRCVVAAGAVVTADAGDDVLLVGIPARPRPQTSD
jgi:UDP-N-acetylbacillosamine N-acetyltransferase